jgi:hypothetical protein
MSKLTSLAIGLLTAVSMLPAAQTMAATIDTPAVSQTLADLHAQIIFNVEPQLRREPEPGPEPRPATRWEAERLRRLEWVRERDARARWAAEHPRSRPYWGDRRDYRRDYRYDR